MADTQSDAFLDLMGDWNFMVSIADGVVVNVCRSLMMSLALE